jgi:hypothetical protein
MSDLRIQAIVTSGKSCWMAKASSWRRVKLAKKAASLV